MTALLPSAAVRAATELAGRTVTTVGPEQFPRATPCRDWDVRGVLDHLAWAAVLAQRSATRLPLEHDWSTGAPAPFLARAPEDRWGALIAEELDVAADAWADVAAWQGETVLGTTPMPAQVVGPMMLADIALHGWDVARAVGAGYPVPDALGEAVLAAVQPIAPMGRDGGWYGPEVSLPAGAPAFDRALGLTGRDPGWTA